MKVYYADKVTSIFRRPILVLYLDSNASQLAPTQWREALPAVRYVDSSWSARPRGYRVARREKHRFDGARNKRANRLIAMSLVRCTPRYGLMTVGARWCPKSVQEGYQK